MTPRESLAAALRLAAGAVPVTTAPPRNAAPPLIAIGPGLPYVRPSTVAGCVAEWRFDVWCCVPRESVNALDEQDALAELVRQAIATMTHAAWLGVNRANVSAEDLAGLPYLATIVETRVME